MLGDRRQLKKAQESVWLKVILDMFVEIYLVHK